VIWGALVGGSLRLVDLTDDQLNNLFQRGIVNQEDYNGELNERGLLQQQEVEHGIIEFQPGVAVNVAPPGVEIIINQPVVIIEPVEQEQPEDIPRVPPGFVFPDLQNLTPAELTNYFRTGDPLLLGQSWMSDVRGFDADALQSNLQILVDRGILNPQDIVDSEEEDEQPVVDNQQFHPRLDHNQDALDPEVGVVFNDPVQPVLPGLVQPAPAQLVADPLIVDPLPEGKGQGVVVDNPQIDLEALLLGVRESMRQVLDEQRVDINLEERLAALQVIENEI